MGKLIEEKISQSPNYSNDSLLSNTLERHKKQTKCQS